MNRFTRKKRAGRWRTVALVLAVPIALCAQTAPPKDPPPGDAGAAAKAADPKGPENKLGAEATAAVESARQEFGDIKNPLQALFEIMSRKQDEWVKAEKAAMAAVERAGKENPCTRTVARNLKPARDSFDAYAAADNLYIRKWSELTADAVKQLKEAVAPGDEGTDLGDEVKRIGAEMQQLKERMAQMPADDPTYDDARKENAKLLELLTQNLDAAKRASEEKDRGERARKAQAELLDARMKEIQEMQSSLEIRKKETANRYVAIEAKWAAACLAWTSKMGQ